MTPRAGRTDSSALVPVPGQALGWRLSAPAGAAADARPTLYVFAAQLGRLHASSLDGVASWSATGYGTS